MKTRALLIPKLPIQISFSFAQARTLPEKVTPPMSTVRKIVIADDVSAFWWVWYSAQPTSRLAIPPKPFSSATISGMDVIAT